MSDYDSRIDDMDPVVDAVGRSPRCGMSESIWTDEDVKQVADRLEASDGLDFEVLARLVLDAVPAVPLREYEALRDAAEHMRALLDEAISVPPGTWGPWTDEVKGALADFESSRAGRTEG